MVILTIFLSLFFAFYSEALSDDCSIDQRIQLGEQGYTKDEINNLCRKGNRKSRLETSEEIGQSDPSYSVPSPMPGFALYCYTPIGACPMARRVIPGSFCMCFTPAGTIQGIAR
jgi:hypothetical protein